MRTHPVLTSIFALDTLARFLRLNEPSLEVKNQKQGCRYLYTIVSGMDTSCAPQSSSSFIHK
jgi:hypothetical protein